MTAYALMALTQKSHPVNINPATSISKTSPFVDLDVSYWAYYDIINLVNSGVISGYPDKTFKPEKEVSRAEFIRFLVYGIGKEKNSIGTQLSFKDVSDTHWAYKLIGVGVNENIISGRSPEKFDPNGKISGQNLLVC